jgi:hypothetical protein
MSRKAAALLVFLVVVVTITGILLSRIKWATPIQQAKPPISVAGTTAKDGVSANRAVMAQKPILFKSTRYPPQTPEEKAMWDWWNKMEKADPSFEWKTPIEFYGKLVDQFNAPVAGATVVFGWTTVVGPRPDPELRVLTDSDGRFELKNIQGKRLGVQVSKDGYLSTRDWTKSFEYAAFFEGIFHIPDPNKPVIFRLQKLLGAEPTYVYRVHTTAKANGASLRLSVEKGAFDSAGEFEFSSRLVERGPKGPEYTVTVQARNGASLAPTTEEFPFLAPEMGYQPTLTLHRTPDDSNYQLTDDLKFYARLADGRFAYVGMEITVVPGSDEIRFYGGLRRNVNWSRNLEFDHRKWINR